MNIKPTEMINNAINKGNESKEELIAKNNQYLNKFKQNSHEEDYQEFITILKEEMEVHHELLKRLGDD